MTAIAAPKPPPKAPLEEITPLPAAPGFVGLPGSYRLGKGGTVFRTNVRLLAVEADRSLFPQAARQRLQIHFPRLTTGDVVRVLDGFYRVDTMHPSRRSYLAFVRLADAEFPTGIHAVPSTYAFPLGGGGTLHGVRLEFPGDCATVDGGDIEVTVRVSPLSDDVPSTLREQTVTGGDMLWIGGKGHRVRQIVSSNPERKFIGWIEIGQDVVGEWERQQ
jgi:hypothetical protein